MDCPIKSGDCDGCEFVKEGFCDWPYSRELDPFEVTETENDK